MQCNSKWVCTLLGWVFRISEKVPLCWIMITQSISNMVFTMVRGVFGGSSWSPGSVPGVHDFFNLSLISVHDFKKMLEVLGVHWKCIAHFCYSGGRVLGVHESALECITNDRSAWKSAHFCSARACRHSRNISLWSDFNSSSSRC